MLFSEVRAIATAEERRRLAREIHDGIAQELASLGYVVDDLAARVRTSRTCRPSSRPLRGSSPESSASCGCRSSTCAARCRPTTGLGTAVSDYVRQVGHGSNLTVHLSLDESPQRLPVDAEAELLRIAQEAITNARKHANAEQPLGHLPDRPAARLPGVSRTTAPGWVPAAHDSFGLEIMRERADRLGATAALGKRADGGTGVEVDAGCGATARRDTKVAHCPRRSCWSTTTS